MSYAVRNDGLGWRAVEGLSDVGPEEYFSPTPVEVRADPRDEFKKLRTAAVDSIKVTVAGHIFDGDEISQGRMARAILGLQAAGEDATITWVLADNTMVDVTAAQLTEALTLAGLEQSRIWTDGMPQ